MQTRTGPGQSATLPSAASMPTKTVSMTKPCGWTSRNNVSTLSSQNLPDTVLTISCSHLLQHIQPIHRSWDARPGSNVVCTRPTTICAATSGPVEHRSSTTRSICPTPFPRSRGSIRRCVVCTSRSKHDTPPIINK